MREAGFEEFVRGEYRRVVRTAYWMTGDQQDAADLAQEAFARAPMNAGAWHRGWTGPTPGCSAWS